MESYLTSPSNDICMNVRYSVEYQYNVSLIKMFHLKALSKIPQTERILTFHFTEHPKRDNSKIC